MTRSKINPANAILAVAGLVIGSVFGPGFVSANETPATPTPEPTAQTYAPEPSAPVPAPIRDEYGVTAGINENVLSEDVFEGAEITEDDPRWDCRTMGNHQCGVEIEGTWYVVSFEAGQPVSVNLRDLQ